MNEKHEISIVYVVTCYGKVVGAFANADDAFQAQMLSVNKGRIAEMVPCPIVYPFSTSKK